MNNHHEWLNRPDVVEQVTAEFVRYETALCTHDVALLNAFFLDSPMTVRFGVHEHSYGIEAVREYRRHAPPVAAGRTLRNTIITALGTDAASVTTEFTSPSSPLIGRQTQTWVRTSGGWKIVAAHVSHADPDSLQRF